jgi:hypothetical protein
VRISQAEVALWVAALALVSTLATANFTYTNRNRELDIELVKLGVAILRVDPKETQTQGAREWALDVIQKFSGVPFTPDARKELLELISTIAAAANGTSPPPIGAAIW